MTKEKKFEIGSIQWLMMEAVKTRPNPFVRTDALLKQEEWMKIRKPQFATATPNMQQNRTDFLIFNDATVRFEISVKIIKEEINEKPTVCEENKK